MKPEVKEVTEKQEQEVKTQRQEETKTQDEKITEKDPEATAEAMRVVEGLVKSCPQASYDELMALYSRVMKECLLMDEQHMKREEKMRELRRLFHQYSVCGTNTTTLAWLRIASLPLLY